MANGRSDGSVIIDTKIDTSGIDKGMNDASRKITAAANSVSKLGDSIKKAFSESNNAVAGKSYDQLQKEIQQTEIQLDKLIEKQIRFVETGGNVKSRAFAGMEYDIENTRNRLIDLQSQLQKVSEKTPQSFSRMERWTGRLKDAFNNLNKTTKKSHYSIMKMLGTSILFSTVFRAISTVTKGFTEGIGNLAQNSEKANATMSALKSSLTQLKNSFATAFMPLISAITPAITSFINMMVKATNYVAAFFSALAGKTTYNKAVEVQEDYAESLNKTAESAKKAQRYLSGLDEIKMFNEKESASVLPEDMFKEEAVETPIFNIAQIIRKAFKEGDWKSLGQYMSDGIIGGLDTLSTKLKSVDWKKIGTKIGEFISGIDWIGVLEATGKVIWEGINAGIIAYTSLFDAAPIETTIITAFAALSFAGVGKALWGSLIAEFMLGIKSAGARLGTAFMRLAPFISEGFSHMLSALNPGMIGELGIWLSDLLEGTFLDTGTWEGPLGALLDMLHMLIDKVFDGITPFVVGLVEEFINLPLVQGFGNVINSLKRSLLGLVDFIGGVFTGNWKRAWEGIKNTFFGIINVIPNAVEALVNTIIDIVNLLIDGVNFVSGAVGIPAIKEIPRVDIPMLATGAVIPPNAPFMAMLGDQKHGTNIEAPLDTIKQAVREVMGSGSGGKYQFTAQINRRTLFDEIIEEAKIRQSTTGRNLFDLS